MNTHTNESTHDINASDRSENRALVSPKVPDAIYDENHQGLLPLDKLTSPLRVEFELWNDARRGDTYQLLWNNNPVGIIKIVTTEQPGDSLFLEVPTLFFLEGVHSVAYRATEVENGVSSDAAFTSVEIDLTTPGLPQLGPMKFPEVVECGLTSAELADLGDQLVAEIGSYADIYQLDEIRTYWGDVEGPGAIVSKTEAGFNRILVTYTKPFLITLGDFDGYVTYTVKDRAGNVSAPSLGAHVQLLLNETLEQSNKAQPGDTACTTRQSSNVVDITLRLQSSLSYPSK
jgi:hypothetical protein